MDSPSEAAYQAVPQPGQHYPLVLGDTILQAHANKRARHSLCCVRYNFRPRPGATQQPGKLLVKPGQQVTMQLPNTTGGDFEGPLETVQQDASNGYDCVAVFDGTCFRIELVGATIRAKYVLW